MQCILRDHRFFHKLFLYAKFGKSFFEKKGKWETGCDGQTDIYDMRDISSTDTSK